MTLECPLCGRTITAEHGRSRCAACGVHLSADHVHRARKDHLRTLIRTHFSTTLPSAPSERIDVLVGASSIADGKRAREVLFALEETKDAARDATEHLMRTLHAAQEREKRTRTPRRPASMTPPQRAPVRVKRTARAKPAPRRTRKQATRASRSTTRGR